MKKGFSFLLFAVVFLQGCSGYKSLSDEELSSLDGTDVHGTTSKGPLDYTPRTSGVTQDGRNIYYVALHGDNTNPGTMESPLLNINYAIYIAIAPAVVYVSEGVYYNTETPTDDYYISMKNRVDLICLQPRDCKIRGPIYPDSNTLLEGFTLLPKMAGNLLTSTNEINIGTSRFGSPHTGNILFPSKLDEFVTSVENVVVKNNHIQDGQFRVGDGLYRSGDGPNPPDRSTAKNIVFTGNSNWIDRTDAQFYGVQVFPGCENIVITGNNLSSGRTTHRPWKQLFEPIEPAGVVIAKGTNVTVTDNVITVRTSKGGSVIGYGIIIMDDPLDPSFKSTFTLSGNLFKGTYIKEVKDNEEIITPSASPSPACSPLIFKKYGYCP